MVFDCILAEQPHRQTETQKNGQAKIMALQFKHINREKLKTVHCSLTTPFVYNLTMKHTTSQRVNFKWHEALQIQFLGQG